MSVNVNKNGTLTKVAGGIVYAPTDVWTATAQVDSNSTVTFTGLDNSLAYDLYVEDKLATITSVTKTGSGTNVTLAYVLSGVSAGDYCKLRIVR